MISQFDHEILDFITGHLKNPFFDWFFPIFTSLGDCGIAYIILGLLLLCFAKTRRSGALLLIFLAVGAVVCNIWLKPAIARDRPFSELMDYILLVTAPTDYSFPSGHTVAAFEAAFALALLGRKPAVIGYALAVLMAFSRLYLYVHWPSDVIAGAALGTIIAVSVYAVFLGIQKYRVIRISR